ncbi:unnamed protein product [Clonostachys rhizophaga]|uniref:Uncharacterized protein n=1 Tax=Clonostachys rhizophaga TaxID=160324 RepID=A0A9N9V8B0_9HYPO|nr:unnamed protein product [Clonostachys rhizophaga]
MARMGVFNRIIKYSLAGLGSTILPKSLEPTPIYSLPNQLPSTVYLQQRINMNSRMHSSLKLLSLLPAFVIAAPASPVPASDQSLILPRDDDRPYYFPVGGIIAIPLAVVALLVVTVGLVRRKYYAKPSAPATQPPTIALADRGRTDTLPVYQREENNSAVTADSQSTSSSGLAKPQDEPPAYAPPPNSSTTPENQAAPATNPSSPLTTSTAQNNTTSEEVPPVNARAS